MIVNEQKTKKKQLQQQLKHQNLPTDILSCSSMDYFLLEISLFDDEHTGKVLSVFVSRAQRDSNISLYTGHHKGVFERKCTVFKFMLF